MISSNAIRVKVTKANYAQRILNLDGKPFSLESVPFMVPVMNCSAERMMLQTGRQVGKSTLLSSTILVEQTAIPHYRTIYTAPRNDQVMQFSKDRLSHMIQYSPYIQDHFVDSTVQQQVRAKEFKNGSMIFLRSCYHTADGIRGISANSVFIDEMQDIIYDNIPVIEECTARKNPRKIIYCGTPKTFDNPIAKLWNTCSQHYWAVKCSHCGHWNLPLGKENVGEDGPICSICGKGIDVLTGQYVATHPSRKFVGFHISQIMLYGNANIDLPWTRLTDKINDPLYSDGKIMNECFGFSYDSGSKLVTESDLAQCCDSSIEKLSQDRNPDWGIYTVGAGIDWGVLGGNTHTVVTLGGLNTNGKIQVFYTKKFPLDQDPAQQVAEIAEILRYAGVSAVAADRGGGHVSNSLLRQYLPNVKVHEIEYKAKLNDGMRFNSKSKSWITDRTRAVAGLILDIKNSAIVYPKFELMRPYFEDILTLMCEYNDRTRAYQIHRDSETPDDFAHSNTYLRLLLRKILPKPHQVTHALEDFNPQGKDVSGEDVIDGDDNES